MKKCITYLALITLSIYGPSAIAQNETVTMITKSIEHAVPMLISKMDKDTRNFLTTLKDNEAFSEGFIPNTPSACCGSSVHIP